MGKDIKNYGLPELDVSGADYLHLSSKIMSELFLV